MGEIRITFRLKHVCLLIILLCSLGLGCTDKSNTTTSLIEDWFEFKPVNSLEDGVIGMSGWLDAPAGKHGVVTMVGDRFIFEDGTPISFWGTNHSNKGCGPIKEEADKIASWYAKMGVNAIRLHKFTYAHRAFGDTTNSSRLNDEGWDRLDYYMSRLKEKGIYYGWSPIFRHMLVTGDIQRVVAYHEIADSLGRSTWGYVNFAPDLQNLLIELTVHLLKHRNPYTKMRYADDPALAFVELQNEDNAVWIKPQNLEKTPTYKRIFCARFSEWLKKKYGTHESLVQAWGDQGLDLFPDYMKGEHLDKHNIYPIGWFPELYPERIATSKSPRRLMDNARFLYDIQKEFYDRYIAAINTTGYRGPLVGSCWQAGYGITHYYNLHTDFEVGIIDRHNYFGARPHTMEPGVFPNGAMVSHPGSGLLSSGLQQVKDRPFVLSEWTGKMPNEWIVEGPAIIGVYGMGLQGWDGSYHFNAAGFGFSEKMQRPNVYNTNNPVQIGLFPALSRMIYRKDIKEGKILPGRKVHIPSLLDGNIGFFEQVRQNADVKELGGDVPVEALALGKLELEFTAQFESTVLPNFEPLLSKGEIRSNTGELYWDYRDRGYFTVNTEGTKAVVGFAQNQSILLDNIEINLHSPFAALFITSLEKDKKLHQSGSALLTVIGRARNTDMKFQYEQDTTRLLSVGNAPILMESIHAEIEIRNERSFKVFALDHDGISSTVELPVRNHTFAIDGSKDKAIWYVIRFD